MNNSRKKEYEDVLDPFSISPGWFVINFITMYVTPGAGLSQSGIDAINITINRLGLNDEGTFLQERLHWIREYCKDDGIPFVHLKKHAPFIAYELERQGLVQQICKMLRFPTPQ